MLTRVPLLRVTRLAGGPLPILVTLYGWIALVKGLALTWLPGSAAQGLYAALHVPEYFYFYVVPSLPIAAYLTYGGFTSRSLAESF